MIFGISNLSLNAISNPWNFAGRTFPILGKIVPTVALLAVFAIPSFPAFAQDGDVAAGVAAKKIEQAGFDQKLNAQIPTDLLFADESGRPVKLSQFFGGGKPVILTLNYYGCPMLCTYILNGVVESLKELPFKVGKEFEIVTVSFDPRDTPQLAAKKKETYLKSLGQPGAETGWHFLTGKKEQIDALCKAVGFSYIFDEKTGEFGHASGIMVATPAGRLSHYFYGVQFENKDLRLALVDASQNRIGSPVDKLLLWCYHYDAVSGKYSVAIMKLVRAGGAATVLSLASFMFVSFRRDVRLRKVLAV